MSAANLLSDAETCMVASQQRANIGLAREAHDFVDLYFMARENEPEPWPGADGDAQDIEQMAVEWEQVLRRKTPKKTPAQIAFEEDLALSPWSNPPPYAR